jgi:hypothetical protein
VSIAAQQKALDATSRPHAHEHEASVAARAAQVATMPKDLDALLRWFEVEWSLEIPAELHGAQVWRDRVSAQEADHGLTPVGASDTGALAYADEFRRRLENAPSEVDRQDPETTRSGRVFFRRPIAAAIARIARDGKPLMSRTLIAVGLAGFDWRGVADRGEWPHEMFEVYLREALIRLWREHREWVRSD